MTVIDRGLRHETCNWQQPNLNSSLIESPHRSALRRQPLQERPLLAAFSVPKVRHCAPRLGIDGLELSDFDNATHAASVTRLLDEHDPARVKHARVLDSLGISLWQNGSIVGVLLANLQDKAIQVRYVFVHPSLRRRRFAELMLRCLASVHSHEWMRVIEPASAAPALRRSLKRLMFEPSQPSHHWLRPPFTQQ